MPLDSKIYCVIVTHNGEKWLTKCLDSLKKSTCQVHVIVIDNQSTDRTIEIIETDFPEVVVLKQSTNLGFGKANNIGISQALKQGAEYVFLLNQDAFIEAQTINKLVNCSKENPGYGILSPIHLNWEGHQLEHYFARFAMTNVNFYSDYVLDAALKSIYEVPFVNAAGWLLPKQTIEIIGGFDPIFEHYGEDNNYCQRILFHGFKIGIVPHSFIYHDSTIRQNADSYLFSKPYFRDEVNKLQIALADLSKPIDKHNYKAVKKHVRSLVFINLLRFDFKAALGYLKKYKIYNQAIVNIKHSRKTNRLKHPHYLEL